MFCLLFLCGCTSEPSSQPAGKGEVFGLSSDQIEDGLIGRARIEIEKYWGDLDQTIESDDRIMTFYDGKPFTEHGVIIEG